MAIRVAIIGCGGIAGGHLNAYLKIQETVPDKVELAAMCDPIKENAERFCQPCEGRHRRTVKATHAIIQAAEANSKIAATAENIRRMPSRRTTWWLMNEKKMLGDMTMFFAQHASYQAPIRKASGAGGST